MNASATPVEPESASARAYLPRLVLSYEAEAMTKQWVPVEGTVVIADITGFTPLSERLAALGKEGAELLTAIINHYFQRLLDSAVALGGDNLKFGGDALLLLFRGEQHADRAVATGLAMQRENKRAGAIQVSTERARLQMRISVHSDTYWSAIVGEDGVRLQHIVAGPGIAKLANIDKIGFPGEVALSDATQALLSVGVVTALREGAIVARSIGRSVSLAPAVPAQERPDVVAAIERWAVAQGGEGEHRKVTVMFARLDGINELLERDEFTAAFEGVDAFVRDMVRHVDRFGGYLAGNDVDPYGIKFIILLGAPIANEEAAANSLRLALALQESSAKLREGLSLRIGLNSGFMFSGEVGATHRREYTVLGDAVNLSARLMSRAEAGEVLVSDATAAEAGPTFRWRPLPPMTIKGKSQPVPVRLLAGEERQATVERSQFEFVGRARERALFAHAIENVAAGRAQVVTLTGEPGSGKSRLISEMLEPLDGPWNVVRAEGLSFTAGMPFAPWAKIVAGLLGLHETADIRDRTELAAEAIRRLDPALMATAALLNPVLSVALPESGMLRSLDADSRRERLLALFGELIAASAKQRPAVVLIQDMHWADQSSREVLSRVAASLNGVPVLLCATSRETLELPGEVTAIALTELPIEEAEALLASVLGSVTLSPSAMAAIAEKCRGNPLFIEEVARALILQGGDDAGTNPMVPDRLQSLLMARLDSLPRQARRIARFAAVLGTAFDADIVREMVTAEDRPSLDLALQDLVANSVIFHDGDGASLYRFRHSLQQEVAYDSLLFARRRELHSDVTSILEERHAGDINAVVETLAYHTGLAGDAKRGARYSTLAGDKARGVYAWESAIAYYNTALQALTRTAQSTGKLRSALLERIGDCLELAGRYGDAATTYVRALDAWTAHLQRSKADLAPSPIVLPVEFDEPARATQLRLKVAVAFERNSQYERSLRWLKSARAVMPARRADLRADVFSSWSVAEFRKGRFREAAELARKALAAARATGKPSQIAYSHHVLANCYGETGRLKQSVFHREAALVIYEQLGDLPRIFAGHGNLGLSYQGLGDFEQSVHHHLECIKAAEQIGNEVAAAIGRLNLGEVLLAQGRIEEARDCFTRTIEVYRQRGQPRVPAGLALVNLSRVALKLEDMDAAKEHLDEGMRLLGAVSRGLATEGILQGAEIALAEGDLEAATAASTRAVDEANALGMLLLEARARLIESRIAVVRGDVREAIARARRSLAIARRLGASYEMAHSYLALAQLAAGANSAKHAERSRSLAQSAAELFERLGAAADLARALELSNQENPA